MSEKENNKGGKSLKKIYHNGEVYEINIEYEPCLGSISKDEKLSCCVDREIKKYSE